jgi:predicted GNAT superfamily acetyltransferase
VTSPAPEVTAAQADAAQAAAEAMARAAGVRIAALRELGELAAACALLDRIWVPGPGGQSPLHLELARALAKAGNYLSGAYDLTTGELIGACMGFFGPPARGCLHSHVTGVLPPGLGRGVGLALKVHQRAWCLREGAGEIQWTFDPLIRRNAYFNLVKVGARPVEYLPDFYGAMNDVINGATETDRLLLSWDLRSGPATDAAAGRLAPASAAAELARGAVIALDVGCGQEPRPVPCDDAWTREPAGTAAPAVLVGVPADIEGMRASDPALAAAWRAALRDALAPLLAAGARVAGFDRDGWYVLTQGQGQGGPAGEQGGERAAGAIFRPARPGVPPP